MKITVLTPTYNRKYKLTDLYTSLVNQTSKNFEWLIVDDGSKDGTKDLVNKFILENKIPIKYIFQKNGGKHRALNKGISMIKTELTIIVDSDDELKNNAIEVIEKYYDKYKDDNSLCGFSFLKSYPNGKIIGDKFNHDEYKATYIKCRINENVKGDKAEVFITRILKDYPFLEIPNENFLFEDYVWIQIGEKYQTIHINEIIYTADYLNDGLTKNMKSVKINSPIGMSERGLKLCSSKINLKIRFKGMIHYISYGFISEQKLSELYKKNKYKVLFVSMLLPSLIYTKLLKRIKAKYNNFII